MKAKHLELQNPRLANKSHEWEPDHLGEPGGWSELVPPRTTLCDCSVGGGFVQPGHPSWENGIEDREQSDLLALRLEALSHFERCCAAVRVPPDQVGAMGLHFSNQLYEAGRRLAESEVRQASTFDAVCLQPVERLLSTESSCERQKSERQSPRARDAEEGRIGSRRVERNEARSS